MRNLFCAKNCILEISSKRGFLTLFLTRVKKKYFWLSKYMYLGNVFSLFWIISFFENFGHHCTQHLDFRSLHSNAAVFLADNLCICLNSSCASFGEKQNKTKQTNKTKQNKTKQNKTKQNKNKNKKPWDRWLRFRAN